MDDWSLISKGIGGILQTKPLLLMIIAVVASSIFAALPGVGSSTLLAMSLPIAMTMQPY